MRRVDLTGLYIRTVPALVMGSLCALFVLYVAVWS